MKTFTKDGAWCFFADPRAIHFQGQYNRTYVGWLSQKGDVWIGAYDHHSKEIHTYAVKKELQVDDHANPALYIDERGYITIFYSAHSGKQMFYRRSEHPENITSWLLEEEIPVNTVGRHGFTYPNPVGLSKAEESMFLFWRGGNYKPNFSTTKDFKVWSDAVTLIKGDGSRPYIKYAGDGKERIYFAFTDGHPNVEEANSIYCAYYHDGSIYRPNGTLIKHTAELPIAPIEVEKVYDATLSGGRAWIWDIALDNDKNPVIVYAVVYGEEDHRYRYARWTGQAWDDHEILKAGKWFPQTPVNLKETEPFYSGGIILDHSDPSNVYLSREINGIFEIEAWSTSDHGQSWVSKPITVHSKKHNVRPIVSRGEKKCLFWMYGDYIHYTDFDTELKMLEIQSVYPAQ